MRFEGARLATAFACAAVLAAWTIGASPEAVAQAPTQEQIRQFQSLPQNQQDALLQQFGLQTSGGGSGNSGTPTNGTSLTVNQSAAPDSSARGSGPNGYPPADDRIVGGEQVLIDLRFPGDFQSPDTTSTPGQPANGNTLVNGGNGTNGGSAGNGNGGGASGTGTSSGMNQAGTQSQSQGSSAQGGSGRGYSSRDPQNGSDNRVMQMRARILSHNPYTLSRYGVLQLPGLDAIPLGGLNASDAQKRLNADPALQDFVVGVIVLRPDPLGASRLRPFGYDMFRSAVTALVPGTDVPVPDDYQVGPGDVFGVQLYGQQSHSENLQVGRDGTIGFPDLGPINVGGMGFGAARALLEQRVRKQLIGTQIRVTLTELRSTRVLVVGDAEHPGAYIVSGLATVTNALLASGGVKPIGSLRKIAIMRGGKLVRRLDLYDVLLKGDTTNDVRLQPGDAVLIPPVGATVAVDGEVRRPAIYELNGEQSLREVIALAGGANAEADLNAVTVEQISPESHDRRMVGVDQPTAEGQNFKIHTGDIVRVGAIRPVVDNGIVVEGHVHRPRTVAFHSGIRLSEVLTSVDDTKPDADLGYVLVRREGADRRKVEVFSADLSAALAGRGSDADILLKPRDRITVFDRISPRDRVVEPLLEELRRQGRPEAATDVVTITGRVNAPGRYPLEPGMKIKDLLRAGGGLDDSAYAMSAELTRYNTADREQRHSELRQIDLSAVLQNRADADVELRPYDVVTIKETPEWGRVEDVELIGEVRFPGKYRIGRGETLSSVIARAGGLTQLAFPEGAVFTREELKRREREQLDRLANRMQADIAALALQSSQSNTAANPALSAGQSLLQQIRNATPVGRLVIDLGQIVGPHAQPGGDIALRDGDQLVVPRVTQEVLVLGEVQNPTSHLARPGLKRDDVIAMSGGMTSHADRRRVYIIHANGSVVSGQGGWLASGNTAVKPGDAVVVPLDAEKMRPLPLWTSITTIIYNLAVALAAISRI